MPITLKDIAERLGLSPAAVSMAINGKPGVSEQTRSLVIETAEQLGYRANQVGKSLRLARTGTIGVYFPSTVLEYSLYYAEITRGISAGLAETDLSPILLPSALESGDVRDFPAVDGFIIVEPHADDLGMYELLRGGSPTVSIDPVPPQAESPWGSVESDTAASTREAFSYLMQQGSHAPGLLTIETVSQWTAIVEHSYRSWCEDTGHTPEIIRVSASQSNEEIRETLTHRLRSASEAATTSFVDGLFVCGDGFALRVAGILRSMGLGVGEDVPVVSGVDSTMMVHHTPPITSVDMDPYTFGFRAASMLTQLLELPSRPEPSRQERLPAPLIVRGT